MELAEADFGADDRLLAAGEDLARGWLRGRRDRRGQKANEHDHTRQESGGGGGGDGSHDNAFYEGDDCPGGEGEGSRHAGDRSVEITPQKASDQWKNSAATGAGDWRAEFG